MENVYYAVDNDTILFLAHIRRGMNKFILSKSEEPYEIRESGTDMIFEKGTVSSSAIKVEFNKYFIQDIEFENDSKIEKIDISINDKSISGLVYNISASNSSIHYKHRTKTELLNITTYIFSKNSKIYNYITPNYAANLSRYEFQYYSKIIGYDSYYANNNDFGPIDYADPDCIILNESFIDFYNSESGVAFILSNYSRIRFCYDKDELDRKIVELNIELPLGKDAFAHLIFQKGVTIHTLNQTMMYKDQPKIIIGAKEIKKGLSAQKMNNLFKTDYQDLKNQLKISNLRDFSIEVINLSNQDVFRYEKKSPGFDTDVFVKRYDCNILQKHGEQRGCEFIIRTW